MVAPNWMTFKQPEFRNSCDETTVLIIQLLVLQEICVRLKWKAARFLNYSTASYKYAGKTVPWANGRIESPWYGTIDTKKRKHCKLL
jgi:hypothetical protein